MPQGSQLSGTGATANVARMLYQDRSVAAKVFKQSSKDKFFKNELKAMIELGRDPNLIEFIGYTTAPRALILEYSDYGSLFSLLHNDAGVATRHSTDIIATTTAASITTNMSPALALVRRHAARLSIGIARGLAALHRHQITHLDLTSRNVLVTRGFIPKITDYGLSAEMGPDGTASRKPSSAPSYWKAPELCYAREKTKTDLTGRRAVFTAKADIFSYAVVLWEVFHPGRFPWDGELHPDLRFCSGDRPQIDPECTPEWRMLIVSCWQQDPDDRPNAEDVAEWTNACLPTLTKIDCDDSELSDEDKIISCITRLRAHF